MEQKINALIQGMGKSLCDMADDIFDHPELPYEEHRSAKILCDWLEQEGFHLERGVGGVPTAFRAVYHNGTGGPVIGLICEYDALPNGHSCGHHMQGPAILGAAYALKRAGIKQPFQLVIYGTPAEEILTGKPRMIAGGCFSELDVALQVHGGNATCPHETSLTGVNLDTTFTGVHAHDTGSPWDARNGFDAFVLASQGVEFLRGHVHDGTRLFLSLQDAGGVAGNADPSRAHAVFSVRSRRMEDKDDLERRLRAIIEGAAMMSGVDVKIEKTLDVMGTLNAPRLNKLWMEKARALGAPQIDENHENKGGSNDFANITHMVPATITWIATVPENVAAHSVQYLKYCKEELCHNATIIAAEIIAQTSLDLITQPELLREITDEFKSLKAQLASRM